MFLTLLTFLSAISISVIAAGYSIVGLATLFAGAVVPIIAMGSALEVGKLVAASWLYHNWNSDVPRLLKSYLFGAIIVLVFITSLGIFGFLSKAHLDQVKPTSSNNIKIEVIDKQINQQEIIIERAEKQINLLDKALEVYIDKEYVRLLNEHPAYEDFRAMREQTKDPIKLIKTLDKFSTTADYDKRVIRIIKKIRKLEDTYASDKTIK